MAPKNKKKFSRRNNKNGRALKYHTNNAVGVDGEQTSTKVRQNKETTDKQPLKKDCLSLIECTAKGLRTDDSNKLIKILEKLFTIFDGEAQKRTARLELINILLSSVKEYDMHELYDVKTKLNYAFMPKELKKIMIDSNNIKEDLHIFLLLGFPLFGSSEAYLKKGSRRIKVKIREAETSDDDTNVIDEAKLLVQLQHENIVKILAFDKTGPRYATEFMKLGDLSSALEQYHFTKKKLFSILRGITSGMIYLSNKKYVLRNLRSHNILLDSDGNSKISNFRYCRYVGDSDGTCVEEVTTLEDEFSAPEVRQENCFSTKSDVWDLAVLACEVFTINPEKVPPILIISELTKLIIIKKFLSNETFPLVDKCPRPLWHYFQTELVDKDPDKRPTFPEILKQLQKYN